MKIPEGLKYSVTPEDVYSQQGVPRIPEGWEFVKFDIPVREDAWIFSDGTVRDPQKLTFTYQDSPRIIVRRKPRRWVVEIRETNEHRPKHISSGNWTGVTIGAGDDTLIDVIREVKPLTQEQINEAHKLALDKYPSGPWLTACLRYLGIEVEE